MAAALPLLLALALNPRSVQAQVPSSFTALASPDGDWSAEIPAGWILQPQHRLHERGFLLAGPEEPGGGRRSGLVINFLAGDHPSTPTPDDYIQAMTRTAPQFKLKATKPRAARVAGLEGKRFKTTRHQLLRREGFKSKRVPFVDEWVVLPAHGGFYALQLSAGQAMHGRLGPAYERFLKSFRLTGKAPPETRDGEITFPQDRPSDLERGQLPSLR